METGKSHFINLSSVNMGKLLIFYPQILQAETPYHRDFNIVRINLCAPIISAVDSCDLWEAQRVFAFYVFV